MEQKVKKKKNVPGIMLDHIVIGIEINEADEVIFQFMKSFLDLITCRELTFVHVIPSIPMVDIIPYEELNDIVLDSEWVDAVRKKIRNSIPKDIMAANINTKIREGSPLEELIKEIEKKERSMLVIGQESDQAKHDISARSMARNSPTNVLVVPEKSTKGIRKILVPVDFSPSSVKALEYAIALAEKKSRDISIECLHIYNVPDISSYKISRSPRQLATMYMESHKQHLRKLVASYDTGVSLNVYVESREMPGVAHYILDRANEMEADLIVIGAKGHSKLELLFMGSVTEKLLHINNNIPTIVIK